MNPVVHQLHEHRIGLRAHLADATEAHAQVVLRKTGERPDDVLLHEGPGEVVADAFEKRLAIEALAGEEVCELVLQALESVADDLLHVLGLVHGLVVVVGEGFAGAVEPVLLRLLDGLGALLVHVHLSGVGVPRNLDVLVVRRLVDLLAAQLALELDFLFTQAVANRAEGVHAASATRSSCRAEDTRFWGS